MVLIIATNRYAQSMYNIRKALANHISSRITMYHVLKSRLAFTKYVTIIEKRSPNIKYSTCPNTKKEYLPQTMKPSTISELHEHHMYARREREWSEERERREK